MKNRKLCTQISPTHGVLCLKPKKHNKTDEIPTHQHGAVVWTGDGTTTFTPLLPPFLADGDVFGMRDDQQPMAPVDPRPFHILNEDEPIRRAEHAMQEAADRDGMQRARAEEEIRGWWFDQAAEEIEGTVSKAIEYSSTDLIDIGRTLAFCSGRQVDDAEAAELGIFFYIQGKLSRWAGAIKSGQQPSDDTIYDIGVYCRMAQRVRHSGGWPGLSTNNAPGMEVG